MEGSEKNSMRLGNLEIRCLDDLKELQATLDLQKRIWGFSSDDCVPPSLMIVAAEIGGLTIGAFSHGQMIGFSLSFPGFSQSEEVGQQPCWYSHMTGVLPEFQGHGVGKRIKFYQRERALNAGVSLIKWTFDPLQIGNAYFNIERLGIIVRRYLPNLYGVTSNRFDAKLPTDRLVAEWHIASVKVQSVIDNQDAEGVQIVQTIKIPKQIANLRSSDSSAAQKIQTQVRDEMQQAFADKLVVVGYHLEEEVGVYELGYLKD